MSDKHAISPYSSTAESYSKVTRTEEMITNLRSSRLSEKFSFSATWEMFRKQYGEYTY